jgi:hypothetical protein
MVRPGSLVRDRDDMMCRSADLLSALGCLRVSCRAGSEVTTDL